MATLTVCGRVDIFLCNQSLTHLQLIFGFVAHGCYFRHRAYIFLGVAVAIQAPAHAQGLGLVHNIHTVDAAVARFAADAGIDVCTVVEIGVIGKVVNTNPFNRLSRFPAVPDFLNFLGTLGVNLAVTVHAGLGGRDIRLLGLEYLRVAVLAIDAQFTCVNLVAVGDGLLRRVAYISVFG